jgi:MFS family permease
VPFHRRFAVFYVCGVVSMAAAGFVPIWLNMPAMLSLAVLFGLTNAVLNSFLGATLQTAVPQDMRGKVFSLFMMIAGGLTPIAFAAGGALAEVVPVRLLISASFAVTLVCFAPLAASRPLRRLVQFNPEADSLECIR